MYAISTHLSIERDSLVEMTAESVKDLALEAGDIISEARAQTIIDCAKEDKEREDNEAAEKSAKKSRKPKIK